MKLLLLLLVLMGCGVYSMEMSEEIDPSELIASANLILSDLSSVDLHELASQQRGLKLGVENDTCSACIQTTAKCILNGTYAYIDRRCQNVTCPYLKRFCQCPFRYSNFFRGYLISFVKPYGLSYAFCTGAGNCTCNNNTMTSPASRQEAFDSRKIRVEAQSTDRVAAPSDAWNAFSMMGNYAGQLRQAMNLAMQDLINAVTSASALFDASSSPPSAGLEPQQQQSMVVITLSQQDDSALVGGSGGGGGGTTIDGSGIPLDLASMLEFPSALSRSSNDVIKELPRHIEAGAGERGNGMTDEHEAETQTEIESPSSPVCSFQDLEPSVQRMFDLENMGFALRASLPWGPESEESNDEPFNQDDEHEDACGMCPMDKESRRRVATGDNQIPAAEVHRLYCVPKSALSHAILRVYQLAHPRMHHGLHFNLDLSRREQLQELRDAEPVVDADTLKKTDMELAKEKKEQEEEESASVREAAHAATAQAQENQLGEYHHRAGHHHRHQHVHHQGHHQSHHQGHHHRNRHHHHHHHCHHQCRKCVAVTDSWVMKQAVRRWDCECSHTSCPYIKSVCAWGQQNPMVFAGVMWGQVNPDQFASGYCLGNGKC